MRLFSSHKVGGRVWELPVKLAKIRNDEIFDLANLLHFMQALDGGVLRSIEGRAEYAQHSRKDELRRRVLAQAVAG